MHQFPSTVSLSFPPPGGKGKPMDEKGRGNFPRVSFPSPYKIIQENLLVFGISMKIGWWRKKNRGGGRGRLFCLSLLSPSDSFFFSFFFSLSSLLCLLFFRDGISVWVSAFLPPIKENLLTKKRGEREKKRKKKKKIFII